MEILMVGLERKFQPFEDSSSSNWVIVLDKKTGDKRNRKTIENGAK